MALEKEFQDKIKSLIDECLIPHGKCDKEFWNYRLMMILSLVTRRA